MIASAPHGPGPFPPASNVGGGMVGRAVLNPLNYSPAVRALFRALDRWVVDDVAPPPSAYPQIADGTLTSPRPRRLARGSRLSAAAAAAARVPSEFRPRLGEGHRQRRAAGSRQAVRASACRRSTPTATCAPASGCRTSPCRWRRTPAGTIATRRSARRIGWPAKSDRTSRSRARKPTANARGDPRLSIEERYRNRDEYVGKFAAAALDLVERGYLLPEDVADLLKHAVEHYDWATSSPPPATRAASTLRVGRRQLTAAAVGEGRRCIGVPLPAVINASAA